MREAGHKIANTFRTFADKPEKEYGEKKFSKTELIKKPYVKGGQKASSYKKAIKQKRMWE